MRELKWFLHDGFLAKIILEKKKLSVADPDLTLRGEGWGGEGFPRSPTDYIHQEYLINLLSSSLAAV